MAEEDQRAAREADAAGGDRREAERGEGSNDSRHEQMDRCICSEGVRFLEASAWAAELLRANRPFVSEARFWTGRLAAPAPGRRGVDLAGPLVGNRGRSARRPAQD